MTRRLQCSPGVTAARTVASFRAREVSLHQCSERGKLVCRAAKLSVTSVAAARMADSRDLRSIDQRASNVSHQTPDCITNVRPNFNYVNAILNPLFVQRRSERYRTYLHPLGLEAGCLGVQGANRGLWAGRL